MIPIGSTSWDGRMAMHLSLAAGVAAATAGREAAGAFAGGGSGAAVETVLYIWYDLMLTTLA